MTGRCKPLALTNIHRLCWEFVQWHRNSFGKTSKPKLRSHSQYPPIKADCVQPTLNRRSVVLFWNFIFIPHIHVFLTGLFRWVICIMYGVQYNENKCHSFRFHFFLRFPHYSFIQSILFPMLCFSSGSTIIIKHIFLPKRFRKKVANRSFVMELELSTDYNAW